MHEIKSVAEVLNNTADTEGCSDDLIVVGRHELMQLLGLLGVKPSFPATTDAATTRTRFSVSWVWMDPPQSFESGLVFLTAEEKSALETALDSIGEEYGDIGDVQLLEQKFRTGEGVAEFQPFVETELAKTFRSAGMEYAEAILMRMVFLPDQPAPGI